MVFLFGALCYTICTMKAPPQALEGPGEEPSWHLFFLVSVMIDKLYCSRPLPALAGRGLMRTLCCAVCAMKESGLGRCSIQHAGGCLIHKLYPLTFSVATRPLSAFAGRGLVVKQCAMPFFLITVY